MESKKIKTSFSFKKYTFFIFKKLLIKYFFSKESHSIYSILRGKIRNVFHCDDAGEIDDFVSDIYLWPFQPVLKRFVSNTCYINY